MILTSLALAFCSCVSSCGPIAKSKDYESLLDTASQIIAEARDGFDYDGFDLTLPEQESLTRQELCRYAEKAGALGAQELAAVKNEIESDEGYRDFGDLDSLFMKKDGDGPNPGGAGLGGGLFNKDPSSAKGDKRNDGLISPKEDLTGPSLDYGDTGGASKEIYNFPLYENDLSMASMAMSWETADFRFFGLYCSKESCAGLYNFFAEWINKQAIYRMSGSGTPLQVAAEGIAVLEGMAVAAGLTTAVITNTIENITAAFASFFDTFASAFSLTDPLLAAAALVIVVTVTACIMTLVSMIVFGALGKGFAIGWKIYKNIGWKWFCGEID